MTITVLERESIGGVKRTRYKVSDSRGWTEFTVYSDDRRLASFGGSVWPVSWPELFVHEGPDKDAITYRSGPAVRPDVVLP